MQPNYTLDYGKTQEKKEKHLNKITDKKLKMNTFIEFMRDKEIKIDRLEECANYVSFYSNKAKDKFKLRSGNFCNNRFCPVCSWLKAKRTAFEILELIKVIERNNDKKFLFITLTAPNVKGEYLSKEITDFNEAFKRLFQTEEFKRMNKGFIRKLEITYNAERNDFHPHFHAIVAVDKSYFKSRNYLSKKRLLELWQRSKRDDSITQVDIKPVKMNSVEEVLEIATYSTKQSELYFNKEVFDVFYEALKGRQLITYNGLFKDYRSLQRKNELNIQEIPELQRVKEKAECQMNYIWAKEIQEYTQMNEVEVQEEVYFYVIEMQIE